MFDRIKTLLKKTESSPADGAAALTIPAWARSAGLTCTDRGNGDLVLEGTYGGRSWGLELGPSTRDFIEGRQLRGKINLNADPNVSVIVMNRALKESLDDRVYKLYTDSVQTMASPEMQDEMRWVTIFEEFGWTSLPQEFWQSYSAMADNRLNATRLVNELLCEVLMNGPEQEQARNLPFTLSFSRSKLYLRMAYQPANLSTVQHAAAVMLTACEVASSAFPVPPA